MSLVISNLIGKLITEIPLVTGFSSKKRLNNPYEIDNLDINSKQVLSNGWGILLGGSETTLASTKQVFSDQAFTIILTKQIAGSEKSPVVLDREIKQLNTDAHELILHLSSNEVWAYPSGVIDVHIQSTDAIEYFNDEKFRMVVLSVNFIAKLEETLD